MSSSTKKDQVYALSGGILDTLTYATEGEFTTEELDKQGTELAEIIYDRLLPPKRAILTDGYGNVVGSVDLIGVARLAMKSELDWQRAVYHMFGLDEA